MAKMKKKTTVAKAIQLNCPLLLMSHQCESAAVVIFKTSAATLRLLPTHKHGDPATPVGYGGRMAFMRTPQSLQLGGTATTASLAHPLADPNLGFGTCNESLCGSLDASDITQRSSSALVSQVASHD